MKFDDKKIRLLEVIYLRSFLNFEMRIYIVLNKLTQTCSRACMLQPAQLIHFIKKKKTLSCTHRFSYKYYQ